MVVDDREAVAVEEGVGLGRMVYLEAVYASRRLVCSVHTR